MELNMSRFTLEKNDINTLYWEQIGNLQKLTVADSRLFSKGDFSFFCIEGIEP